METIVHDPFNRITAKEANLRATKKKENAYKERLKSVYGAIHANISLGRFETEQIIDGFEEADYVFNQLVMKDEYAVTLGAVNSDPDDERMKLTISWDSESLIDPNKKYILNLELFELETKIEKLQKFIDCDDFLSISTINQMLLANQMVGMAMYRDSLHKRIKLAEGDSEYTVQILPNDDGFLNKDIGDGVYFLYDNEGVR